MFFHLPQVSRVQNKGGTTLVGCPQQKRWDQLGKTSAINVALIGVTPALKLTVRP